MAPDLWGVLDVLFPGDPKSRGNQRTKLHDTSGDVIMSHVDDAQEI